MNSIDVLIVGAGPSGLTFAIECIRYGLKVRIIEKNDSQTAYSKAIAIQARTLETFQRMGISKDFLSKGKKINAANIYSNKKRLAHIFLDQIPSPFPFVLSVPQNITENILINHLKHLGCLVERSTNLESFDEKDGLIYSNTNKEIIRSKYLIGCDGAHSIIRKNLGCTFEGKLFPDIFSLADVEINWDLSSREVHVFLEKEEIMAAFPLPEENRYRLIFQLKRLKGCFLKNFNIEEGILPTEDKLLPTISEIQSSLSSYIGKPITVSNPRWIANFHINSRISNTYRKGNIFLIGDAAHIHSPVGGQGMNTGIQDAFNLAWKIGYVHKGLTHNKKLLNSYEEERLTLGKKLLKSTEQASKLITNHNRLFFSIRNHLISFFSSFKSIQKFITKAISEVGIVCGNRRMEDILVESNGVEKSFYSLTEGSTKFHLIVFGIDDTLLKHPQVEIFKVRDRSIQKAILVRPDGYIAIVDTPPFRKLLHYKI